MSCFVGLPGPFQLPGIPRPWRTQGAPPFSPADIDFLDHIAGPVTTALRHSQAKTFVPAAAVEKMPAGPVVLLLSPALDVRAQTPQTQRYLRVLVPRDEEDQAPIARQRIAKSCAPWAYLRE